MDEVSPAEYLTGVVLAGGAARRMGGCDKCLLPLDKRPILEHIIARAQPQVKRLLLNTNSDAALFSRYDLPIISDSMPGFAGPLAGILAAMEWLHDKRREDKDTHAREHGEDAWLASFPGDSPFFPQDLVARLCQAARQQNAEIACAASNDGRSPLFALWSTSLRADLREQLEKGERAVGQFLERHRYTVVQFNGGPIDPFFNINTVEDLKLARDLSQNN